MRPNLTCDRLRTGCASLREQFAVTVSTVRLLVFRCEPLSGQLQVALRAREALPMPWLVTVGHTSSSNNLNERTQSIRFGRFFAILRIL